MKINEIAIERKFNLGNYETQMIRIVVCPEQQEQGENWEEIVGDIAKKVNTRIYELQKELKENKEK